MCVLLAVSLATVAGFHVPSSQRVDGWPYINDLEEGMYIESPQSYPIPLVLKTFAPMK